MTGQPRPLADPDGPSAVDVGATTLPQSVGCRARVAFRYAAPAVPGLTASSGRGGRVGNPEGTPTGYGDGLLHLPSGHLEALENVVDGVIREVHEEVGVTVAAADVQFAHVMHRAAESGVDRIGLFFTTNRWAGTVRNAEPGKCSELVWADPDHLPPDTIAYPAAGIAHARAAVPASTFGFPPDHAVTTGTDAHRNGAER